MSATIGNRGEADDLLARAYGVENREDALALYRDWATTYDQTMLDGLGYLTPARTADLLVSRMTDKAAPVLDVGCGTGLAGLMLGRAGFSCLDGIDLSREMLSVARKSGVYRELFCDDVLSFHCPGQPYDGMICTGTFTHAHVGAGALQPLFAMLKPGGLFACTVHKDIWEAAGFSGTAKMMAADGILAERHRELGTYFESSTEPEGWYIVWEKLE